MYSYMAIVEKPDANKDNFNNIIRNIKSSLPEYVEIFENDGIVVMHKNPSEKGMVTYKVHQKGGVVVGTLFSKYPNPPKVKNSITEEESAHIINTDGRHLVDNYWGRYVAFINNKHTGDKIVICDPSGSLALFYYETDHATIFFSDAEDFSALKIVKLSFNIDRIVHAFRAGTLYYADTGFVEIKKVLRGHCLHFRKKSIERRVYWHPTMFARNILYRDISEAATALRQVVMHSVHAWASAFDSVTMRLSGGLDSSIVASCLSTAPSSPTVIAVNIYADDVDADEREYARSVASASGLKLVEIPVPREPRDPREALNFRMSAEIDRMANEVLIHWMETEAEEMIGAQARFGGRGGDGVFGQGYTWGIVDYAQIVGFDWQFLSQSLFHAERFQKNVFSVLKSGVKARFHTPEWSLNKILGEGRSQLLAPEAAALLNLDERMAHWTQNYEDLPIGKKAHLFDVGLPVFHHIAAPPNRSIRSLEPLLSQPIIEVALGIPTYLMSWNGVDRAVARTAFRGIVPEKNIRRQGKAGGGRRSADEAFKKVASSYRDLLIDGKLMSMGILDKEQVRTALAFEGAPGPMLQVEIMEAAMIEIWLRRWASTLNR